MWRSRRESRMCAGEKSGCKGIRQGNSKPVPWHLPVIPPSSEQRREDLKFKISLDYKERPSQTRVPQSWETSPVVEHRPSISEATDSFSSTAKINKTRHKEGKQDKQDGLAGKGACHQTGRLELEAQNQHRRRREPTLERSSLTSTHPLWHAFVHRHIKQTNQTK